MEKIEAAITAVSNASVFSASNAIYKAAEEKDRHRNTELFEKVVQVFGNKYVAKAAELKGRDAVWDAHNVVILPSGRKAIFEYVSESQNSIASKFMMFSDLAKADHGFSLTSVVSNIERIGKKGSMLADVSTILALAANDDEYRTRAIA